MDSQRHSHYPDAPLLSGPAPAGNHQKHQVNDPTIQEVIDLTEQARVRLKAIIMEREVYSNLDSLAKLFHAAADDSNKWGEEHRKQFREQARKVERLTGEVHIAESTVEGFGAFRALVVDPVTHLVQAAEADRKQAKKESRRAMIGLWVGIVGLLLTLIPQRLISIESTKRILRSDGAASASTGGELQATWLEASPLQKYVLRSPKVSTEASDKLKALGAVLTELRGRESREGPQLDILGPLLESAQNDPKGFQIQVHLAAAELLALGGDRTGATAAARYATTAAGQALASYGALGYAHYLALVYRLELTLPEAHWTTDACAFAPRFNDPEALLRKTRPLYLKDQLNPCILDYSGAAPSTGPGSTSPGQRLAASLEHAGYRVESVRSAADVGYNRCWGDSTLYLDLSSAFGQAPIRTELERLLKAHSPDAYPESGSPTKEKSHSPAEAAKQCQGSAVLVLGSPCL